MKTWIWGARTQNSLEIRNENVNLGCQNAEFIRNPQRKHESGVPGKAPSHRHYYFYRLFHAPSHRHYCFVDYFMPQAIGTSIFVDYCMPHAIDRNSSRKSSWFAHLPKRWKNHAKPTKNRRLQRDHPEGPKGARVTKMSFGAFWKVHCNRKSS